jgi:hypothetical protein
MHQLFLGHGTYGEDHRLKAAVAACVATKNEENIKTVSLKNTELLQTFNRQNDEKKLKRRTFNDDEDEDFEERVVAKANAKTLDFVKQYTHLLNAQELKAYHEAVKEFHSASKKQQQDYIRKLLIYINQCAAGQKVGKRAELADEKY